jgi:cbb3-type cytochrome oxidase maturation protein
MWDHEVGGAEGRAGETMNIIFLLILSSLGLALCALAGFVWCVRSGQFDDTCTPSMRILTDDPKNLTKTPNPKNTLP